MLRIGRTRMPRAAASAQIDEKDREPSDFRFTSASGVVRASSSIRSECCTREIHTFWPLTT